MYENQKDSLHSGMVYGGQYEILNSISKSNNTKVFQAYYSDDESSPRKLIMFKRIAYNKFKESKEEVVKKIKDTHQLMLNANSPFLTKYHRCSETMSKDYIQISMQYLCGHNLFQYFMSFIKCNKRGVSLPDALAITKQVINCVKEVHELKKKQHGSLKFTDLVFHNNLLKIINSGTLQNSLSPQSNQQPNLYSPETLKNQHLVNRKVDVWSIGALLLVALTWKETNQKYSHYTIYEKLNEEEFPMNLKGLLKRCLKPISERISLEELQIQINMLLKSSLPHSLYIYNYFDSQNPQVEVKNRKTILKNENQQVQMINHEELVQSLGYFQEDVEVFLSQVAEAESSYFELVKIQYLNDEIAERIQTCSWGLKNKGKKQFDQILFFFYHRLHYDVSEVIYRIKKIKNKSLIQSILSQVETFRNKIKTQLDRTKDRIFEHEKTWGYFFKFPIEKFRSQYKYLNDIEGKTIGFKRDEQVNFLFSVLESRVMKGLKKDSNEDMELYKRLKILKDIMKIRFYPQVEIENQVRDLMKEK